MDFATGSARQLVQKAIGRGKATPQVMLPEGQEVNAWEKHCADIQHALHTWLPHVSISDLVCTMQPKTSGWRVPKTLLPHLCGLLQARRAPAALCPHCRPRLGPGRWALAPGWPGQLKEEEQLPLLPWLKGQGPFLPLLHLKGQAPPQCQPEGCGR